MTINHEMISLAREARGLSQSEFAQKTAISQSKLSKLEMGILQPDDDTIRTFASKLHFPVSFFSQQGRRLPIYFFHRKRRSLGVKLLARIHARLEIRIRRLKKLLQFADRSAELNYLWSVPLLSADGDIERIAALVRLNWKLPRGPIENLTRAIEDAGGFVIPFDFETPLIDAVGVAEDPPVFFVNSKLPGDRLRFSLAHELGHVIMHSHPTEDPEREADEFASEFLMPHLDIYPHLTGKVTLEKLADLKRYWKVSMQALLKRAGSLKLISSNQERYLWQMLSLHGMRKREPIEIEIEQPSAELEILGLYRQELSYSLEEIARILDSEEDEFFQEYQQTRRSLHLVKAG